MSSRKLTPHVRHAVRMVESEGFTVTDVEFGRHARIRTREGPTFTSAYTPSDHRAALNLRADIRRARRVLLTEGG